MWQCLGSLYRGSTCSFLGKFIDAHANFENALSSWNPSYRTFASSNPRVTLVILLSQTLLRLGYIDRARLRRDEALAEARWDTPYTLALALSLAWYCDWIEGMKSNEAVLRSADKIITISSEQGFALWFGVANVLRGWCLGTAGQKAEGIPLLVQGVAEVIVTGCNLGVPFLLIMLAEVYGLAGQPEKDSNGSRRPPSWLRRRKSAGRRPNYIACGGPCCCPCIRTLS
jgi:hypothetical protein